VLEALLKKNRIPLPKEEPLVQKYEEKEDGVIYEGEMTYNITESNMKRAERQIKELTELNVNHKEEIKRLKNQLSSYERPKPPTPQKSQHNKENLQDEDLVAEIQEYRETQQRLLEQLESNATQIERLTH